MLNKLFKFMETKKVALSDELKSIITEAFNAAVKEKSDELSATLEKLNVENSEIKGVLKEAAGEINSLRTAKTEEVKKEVSLFESKMVDKLSKFLDMKLTELVPQNILEAQAKLEVYEPLIESIKGAFETKGISIDSKGYGVLREAKEEIVKLKGQMDKEISKNLQLEEATEKLLGKYLLKEKIEGMTLGQQKKVLSIFEGASYDEIEKRFDAVKNLVLTEEVTEDKGVEKDKEPIVQKRIDEDFSPEGIKTIDEDVESAWKRLLQ